LKSVTGAATKRREEAGGGEGRGVFLQASSGANTKTGSWADVSCLPVHTLPILQNIHTIFNLHLLNTLILKVFFLVDKNQHYLVIQKRRSSYNVRH